MNEVRESYNNVALNTTLVASQLTTIRAALEALYEWRASDQDLSGASRQLDKDLGMSLSCCAILISVIDGKLDESGHRIGLKQKIRYLWLENILKEYISNLEGQVRALQLLLTIFQCRTATEKRQILANAESRTIIEQLRAETASLALDNIDFHDAASVLSLNPSVTLDIDSILLRSPAYARVYGHARLGTGPVTIPNPVEDREEANSVIQTSLNQNFPFRTLPSQGLRKKMPQSRGRINVWDYYHSEEEGTHNVDATIMAKSRNVFELSGNTQRSSAASQPTEALKLGRDTPQELEDTAAESFDRKVKMTSVGSMDRLPEIKPLQTQTEKKVAAGSPAAVGDAESIFGLDGFINQLDLAFKGKSPSQNGESDSGPLYGAVVDLKIEKSPPVSFTRDEASPDVSRNGSKEVALHLNEDLGPDTSGQIRLREEKFNRPMSRHSSLYECSMSAMPEEQSTRTSSQFSCDSCRNLGARDQTSENDRLEAEIHELVRSSPQPETESVNVQKLATDECLTPSNVPDKSEQSPLSTLSIGLNNSNVSHLQAPINLLHLLPNSSTAEQQAHNRHPSTYSADPLGSLVNSDSEGLEWNEKFESNASSSLRHPKTLETSDPHIEVTKKLPSRAPFFSCAESKTLRSERSTLSSNRGSSAHGATSTIFSSEAHEDSTILSLQESTSNTTATSVNTHAPGLDTVQGHSDLHRLQDDLAAAKARGDSRSVQDSLQRSIEAIRGRYLPGSAAEDKNTPRKSPSPRLGKARTNFMRFPSLPGSTKSISLGEMAASGNTTSVQNILKERVNVDSRSDNFKTPLMRAAMSGHVECMKLLKHSGADEIAVDAKGRTALHLAVASNRLAAVKWLLENYPPPTPDLLRQRPSILFRATDLVKSVRSQKNLRETSDAEGSKPLHIAAELDKGGIVKTLVAAGVDVESKDNWGRTPFHRAILSKRCDSFDALFRSGAKIAAVDVKSASSLHLAAEAGQVDMIVTLLANGAKRSDFDANGYQPIHSAVWGGNLLAIKALSPEREDLERRTRTGETLLHLACLKKDLDLAHYLLAKLVDVNPWAAPGPGVLQNLSDTRIKGSSMIPFHYACCTRDFEMAVLLLDHEALVNAPTPEGATALMMAVETEDTNMVNLLLQREAKVNAKIPGSLTSALHLASRRGDLETVQQLCRHHADDRARTNKLSSPFDECAKCPDKKKGQEVETYLRTIATNRLNNTLLANARKHQASHLEPHQPHNNPPGAQIQPLTNPVSYAPWAMAQRGNSIDQGFTAQHPQAQKPQHYTLNFDVPDETLPAYQAGSFAPASLVNQAPVHRERYG